MANLIYYNPFDELFKDFSKVRMKLDVKEDDKSYTIRAEIPGVKKEDIKIDIEGNLVSLRAEVKQEKEEKKDEKVVYSERSYGMASRSFTLPTEVDAQGAKAEYKDGLLSLSLPKKANGSAQRVAVT